jgi:hypothetical protein
MITTEDEMSGTYTTHGGHEKNIQNYLRKPEGLVIDGRIILKWILKR